MTRDLFYIVNLNTNRFEASVINSISSLYSCLDTCELNTSGLTSERGIFIGRYSISRFTITF